VIYNRADAKKNIWNWTTWDDTPDGKIQRDDVSVVKNYLSRDELSSLERIVSAYLDLAEDRARRHIPMTMEDWAKRLDIFLQADGREILTNAGKISAQIAKEHAESEVEKYRIIRDKLFESDYDKQLKLLEQQITKTASTRRRLKMN
jgi:Virulence protein